MLTIFTNDEILQKVSGRQLQKAAMFWTIDEENRGQFRKRLHHRHYTRQQTQRKTTRFLDQ